MTEKAEIMRVLTSSPGDLVRSYFKRREAVAPRVDPRHTDVPTLRGADVAAVYYQVRVAGDFYEFLRRGAVPCVVRPARPSWPQRGHP
jgi:hypothetical protein